LGAVNTTTGASEERMDLMISRMEPIRPPGVSIWRMMKRTRSSFAFSIDLMTCSLMIGLTDPSSFMSA